MDIEGPNGETLATIKKALIAPVRGRQLDGPNGLRFGGGNVPATELLFHAPGEARPDPPNGWTYEIDNTRVRAPGCYAYQIDGETFSDVVIFRAVPLT